MDVFIGMLGLFGFGWAPRGWMTCEGQLLPIAQYQALFALIGTTYGGDGVRTFGLPDLRGRAPISQGSGQGIHAVGLGEIGGSDTLTLQVQNLPPHNHTIATASAATTNNPKSNVAGPITDPSGGGGDQLGYAADTAISGTMSPKAVGVTGNGVPISSRDPYLALQWCIATEGIFPSRP